MDNPASISDLSTSKRRTDITLTLTNLLTFLTIMSPFLLTFFMLMMSIVNHSIVKGLLFLIGLVIIGFLTYLSKSILKEKQSILANPLCNILPMPFTTRGTSGGERVIFSSPILSTSLLGYIASYLIFPMYINNDVNHPLLIFLIGLFLINAVTELHKKCGTLGGVVLGGILGIAFGIIYYGMIAGSGYKDLAYFSEIKSSAEGCRKPTDQKFKCVVYKRGGRPMWD